MTKQKKNRLLIIWWIMTLVVYMPIGFVYLTGDWVQTPVTLQQDFQTEWRTWRPFQTRYTGLEMGYPRYENTELEEQILGDIRDPESGTPVHILVSVNGKHCVMAQEPMSGRGMMAHRHLTPFAQSQPECDLSERAGTNHWQITVQSVGEPLRGVQTVLMHHSPYGFKAISDDIYGKISLWNIAMMFIGAPIWLIFSLFLLWQKFLRFGKH